MSKRKKISKAQEAAVQSINEAEADLELAKGIATSKIVGEFVCQLFAIEENGDMSGLIGNIVTITPEQAKALLQHSAKSNFRKQQPRRVMQYARDMRAGRWDVNAESIKLDKLNRVIDGQHRLAACVAANVPFKSLVVANVPAEEARSVDSGMKRTLAQVLRAEGYHYWGELAQAARWSMIVRTGNVMSCHADRFSPPEVLKYLRSAEGKRLPEFVSKIARMVNVSGQFVSRGLLAGLVHAASLVHAELAEIFAERLLKGENLKCYDPAYVLRRKYIEMFSRRGAMRSEIIRAALFFKAFNAELDGEPIERLYWGFREDFPKTGFEGNWKKELAARARVGFVEPEASSQP